MLICPAPSNAKYVRVRWKEVLRMLCSFMSFLLSTLATNFFLVKLIYGMQMISSICPYFRVTLDI